MFDKNELKAEQLNDETLCSLFSIFEVRVFVTLDFLVLFSSCDILFHFFFLFLIF